MRRALVVLLLAIGCSRATTPPVTVFADRDLGQRPIRTLAVMAALPASDGPAVSPLALEAVSELIAQSASREVGWRVIEPEQVAAALGDATDATPIARAARAARGVQADATLTAIVQRYRERVGSDFGVSEAASVDLTLLLVAPGADRPMWKADYAFTQEPLSYNLWNFWGVLRGGPRWLTAGQLARIGVDEAVDRLRRTSKP